MSSTKTDTILVIPDLHFPFQHKKTFQFLEIVKKTYRPSTVVCIGDLVDHHALSTFVKGEDRMSGNLELTKTKRGIETLGSIFPVMNICLGNHESRLFKRAKDAGIPISYLKGLNEVLGGKKGWIWSDHFLIDNILFQHGDSYTASNWIKAPSFTGKNTVIGHTHSGGGVYYFNNHWSLNTGCLVDEDTYAFEYAKNFKQRCSLGCGIIQNNIPHFIPLAQTLKL